MIELGDGQVSDRKSWPVEAMVKLLWALSHTTKHACPVSPDHPAPLAESINSLREPHGDFP
jgi:hypothetical protein